MISILVLSVISVNNPTYDYSDIMGMAYVCKNAKVEHINSDIVEKLVEIEDLYFQKYNIPEDLRGMLLAAACVESGYNPKAKGDWKITFKTKKHPRAKGILQFWQWAEKRYALNRFDPIQSAHVWMQHVANTRNKNLCRGYRLSKKQKWLAAWAQAVRSASTKENKFRCFQRTKHWKELRRWKRIIKLHKEMLKNEEPGC